MFKSIVLTLAIAVVIVLGYAVSQPDSFRVERTISIKAASEKVFPLINDFHHWTQWSPWENIDPALKRTYSGADSGKGTVYAWEGNDKVGAGRMEITDSSAPSKIVIKLDFLKPFEAHNTAEFMLQAKGDTTDVTWAMFGPSPFMAKLIGVFMSMDQMVGKDFETGLANLKVAAEK
jgi:Polyketide cyclase / dehydrase and lipid transport